MSGTFFPSRYENHNGAEAPTARRSSRVGRTDCRRRASFFRLGKLSEASQVARICPPRLAVPSGFSGGDANLYRYCGNNSPNNNDPSGLCWKGVDAGDSIGSTTSEKELWFNNSIASSNFITPSSSAGLPSWVDDYDFSHQSTPSYSTGSSSSTSLPADLVFDTTSIFATVPPSYYSPQSTTATQSGPNGMALYAPDDVDYQYNAVHNDPSAGEAFSHVANWAGDSITDLSVQTGYSSVAAVGGAAGSLVKSAGGVVAAFDPFYSAENIIQDISTSIDYGKEYGLAVGLARQIGLLQLAEAYVGVDIQTGKAVNWVDKVAEGAGRLGGTAASLAGGLKLTGLGGKTAASQAAPATQSRVRAAVAESKTAREASNFKVHLAKESQILEKPLGSFFDEMAPTEAARYQKYWNRRHDTSGSSPFNLEITYTKNGQIKTVTTFDQHGRPHRQYGLKEGEPVHQHKFEYPISPRQGTGLNPIRLNKGPIND